jgi:hypothetical protein
MFRAACRARTAIAVFAIALLPALAQKAERGGPLEKPFIAPAEFVSIGQRVLTLFNRAGMHGGIAIVSEQCTEPTEQFPEFQEYRGSAANSRKDGPRASLAASQ